MTISRPQPFEISDHDLSTKEGLQVALEATNCEADWEKVYDGLPPQSKQFWFPVAVQSGLMARMKVQWGYQQPEGTHGLD